MDDSDDNKPFTLCPGCGKKVEPANPGTVYGVQLVRVETFGGTDWIDGMGAFFHDEAHRARSGYQPRPMLAQAA
jgi:hypothetical protein